MDDQTPSLIARRGFLAMLGLTAAGGATTARAQDAVASIDADQITADTFAHAQRLAGLELTEPEREMMAVDFAERVAGYADRRAFDLPNGTGPATTFDPRPAAFDTPTEHDVRRTEADAGPPPTGEADIAFAPVARLSRWIESGAITSERLTRLYLDRLKRHGPKLECVVTLTEERAIALARRADQEIAQGQYRGPLHGIPWGAKDLFDTAGIRTTFGARPYKGRVAETDAHVVRRLDEAGAVLVAKLTLGALAYGDIWFDGVTKNPWDLKQGSSGSSAGSASATAAGLVGFSLGTETYGSIVSPCMRCGATGLRPTFGRVGRSGAMALCWSLDKIGPITRSVEDAALVLDAINGRDPRDASSINAGFAFDAGAGVNGIRVGYQPDWFSGPFERDRVMLDHLRDAGAELVDLTKIDLALPEDWPYASMLTSLYAEAAAAFEELTLTDRDDELEWQAPQAWPNSFRQTWFVPAVELIQAERVRRRVMEMMAERFAQVDVIANPAFAAGLLLITNMTGHPCTVLRSGFDDNGRPRGVTLLGRLFGEGRLCNAAMALERAFGVAERRPPGFD